MAAARAFFRFSAQLAPSCIDGSLDDLFHPNKQISLPVLASTPCALSPSSATPLLTKLRHPSPF
jgi:hypothetical protein